MEPQTSRSSSEVDFTYHWYGNFLDRIESAGYEFRRFSDDVGEGDVILRHDVDLSLTDAVNMALIEADRGVNATYCFLLTSALYNPLEQEQRTRIREIRSLGHEVALHFSTHEYWDAAERPDDDTLLQQIGEERAVLGWLVPDASETVSFHSPPEWVLNRELEDVRSTYGPDYFSEMTYVADSGQRWRREPPTPAEFGASAQVLTHPGLWSDSDGSFEQRIERKVTDACRHANEKAQREFIEGDA